MAYNVGKSHLKKRDKFIEAARPLIKFIAENYHPHATVMVTCTDAILSEGSLTTGQIMDYIKD